MLRPPCYGQCTRCRKCQRCSVREQCWEVQLSDGVFLLPADRPAERKAVRRGAKFLTDVDGGRI